ncbi:MAG TPA: hypothetical protein VGK50_07075 [Coriobacteriia bacterium]|jgi:hypothetical protein
MKRIPNPRRGGAAPLAVSASSAITSALVADLELRLGAEDPEEGFVDFVEQALGVFPSFRRYRERFVGALRAAVASTAMTERMSGGPLRVVEFDQERETIVSAWPLAVLDDIAIVAEARGRVLDEPMMEATEVSELLGSKSTNKRQYAQRLRRQGKLVAVSVKNKDYYPLFQFDLERRQVRDAVAEVNRILGSVDDPWGVASWWVTPNGALDGGRAPRDLLGDEGGGRMAVSLARDLVEAVG